MAGLPQWAGFQFPDFGINFPYQNLPAQLTASMQQPQGLSSYGRFNGTGVSGAPGAPGGDPTAGGNVTPGGHMIVPAPPLTPGMQVPPLNPGQSPFTAGLSNVPPAGTTGGLLQPYVPPMTAGNVPPAGTGQQGPTPTVSAPPVGTTPPVSHAPMNPVTGGVTPSTGGAPLNSNNKAMVRPDTVSPGLLSGGGYATNSIMNSPLAGQLQKALSYGDGRSKFAQAVLDQSGPQSVTPQQFNQVAATNPSLALTLMGMGGGQFQQAVAKQNGWSPQQLNQWINSTFYGNPTQGLTPQALAYLRSSGIR